MIHENIQLLDRRLMLAATATLTNGLLTVTGTPGDDHLIIRKTAEQPDKNRMRLAVKRSIYTDTKYVEMTILAFYKDEVKSSVINLGEGNDEFLFYANFSTRNGTSWIPVTINGGEGNDSLFTDSNSFFTINGGNGSDSIVGNGLLNSGTGGDSISVRDVANKQINTTVIGSEGKDWINAYTPRCSIYSGDGDDEINGPVGYLDAGKGNDLFQLYDVNTEKSVIHLGEGNDVATNLSGTNITLYGDAGDDDVRVTHRSQSASSLMYFYGGSGNDNLEGSIGREYIDGGTGIDSIATHAGNDTVVATDGEMDEIAARNGNDVYQLDKQDHVVSDLSITLDKNGVLRLVGAPVNESLAIKYENEISFWYGEAYSFPSGPGDPGGSGISGDLIKSIPIAGVKSIILDGGGGNDRLSALLEVYDQAILLSYLGGDGDDHIEGVLGVSTASGGNGNDTIVSSEIAFGDEGNDTLIGCGSATGGKGNDEINDVYDYADGGEGDDRISGISGRSTLLGGSGNDTLTLDDQYGYSPDIPDYIVVDAGAGNDQIHLLTTSNHTTYTFKLGDGNDTLQLDQNPTYFDFTGIIQGNAGDDRILMTGSNFTGTIDGGDGNDSISGGNKNETLIGGTGNDTLIGGGGNDRIYGNGGSDRIFARDNLVDTIFADASDIITRDQIDLIKK